ncbi:MAG: RHS repeat-associated core domain-containing protein, partial [Acidobacteriota bacterium]
LGGMLDQLTHANTVVEAIAPSPSNLQRPDKITTSGVMGGEDWDSGQYLYDSSGNVKAIGDQLYTYDRMSRLTVGNVDVDGVLKPQTLTYDPYGNITSLDTNGSEITTEVDTATNRLTGASYDAGGNLTGFTLLGEQYEYDYDPLNMMKHLRSNTDQARVFLYDADDERILAFDCPADDCTGQEARLTATIRGLDNKVLRVYEQVFGESWEWQRDYVYREGSLLAAVEPGDSGESTVHFHLDHLGTPRQITDASGAEVAFHAYYPFGGEATDAAQDDRSLKFTGHERDGNGSAGAGMLDYMHARYCAPGLGRFFSVDPVESSNNAIPQTWNKYSYGLNNPVKFVDPNGETAAVAFASTLGGAPALPPFLAGAPQAAVVVGGGFLAVKAGRKIGGFEITDGLTVDSFISDFISKEILSAPEIFPIAVGPLLLPLMSSDGSPDPGTIRVIRGLPDGATLTQQQAEELSKNIDVVLEKSLPNLAKKGLGESVVRLLSTDSRFRFIDQVDGAREKIVAALEEFNLKLPEP